MTILVDASAIVSIMTGETDAKPLTRSIEDHNDRLYCAVGAWEAVRAVARIRTIGVPKAQAAFDVLCHDFGMRLVAIGDAEGRIAIDAHRRYGKGTGHLARLNLGDCFAYACARTNDAKLLYKGNDFIHTDLA